MTTTPAPLRILLIGTLVLTAPAVRAEPASVEPAADQSGGNRHRQPDRRSGASMACQGLVGTWRWFDRGTVTITSDLRAEWRDGATNRVGHTANGECDPRTGTVTFAWTNGVTDVIQRPGDTSLQGRNNLGMTIWANRLADPRQAPARPVSPGPGRTPRDAPRAPAPPSTAGCARTFEEAHESGQGLPPLLLADRLAKSPLPENGIPDALRGTGGSPRVSMQRGTGAGGLCATVRVALPGSRALIEYRIYAPRDSAPPYIRLLDDHDVFNERRFNDSPWQLCQFVDERSLSIACMSALNYPGAIQQQALPVARFVAPGGDTAAIEQVRQLAVAAQRHALGVEYRLEEARIAWLMARRQDPSGAGRSTPGNPARGDRPSAARTYLPLILGLGALAVFVGFVLVVIAAVVLVVFIRAKRRRGGAPPAA